jgi:hypothetical protein
MAARGSQKVPRSSRGRPARHAPGEAWAASQQAFRYCAVVSFTSLRVLRTFWSWQQPTVFLGTGQQQCASLVTETYVRAGPQKCILCTSPGLGSK